jgi:hypothetical protein
MGSKKEKKRFFIVSYIEKPDGKFDEYVELSKKKVGSGKLAQSRVVLDLINNEVVKVDLPNVPKDFPFDALYQHYRKWYADVIDQFLK